jgi:hypothetical protein
VAALYRPSVGMGAHCLTGRYSSPSCPEDVNKLSLLHAIDR